MTEISKEAVLHTVELARLELTEKEKTEFTREFGRILAYVDELNEVDVSGTSPVSQIAGIKNIVRPDEVTNLNSREKLLANAPETKDGFISVPKIFNSQTETSLPETKSRDVNE